MTSLSMILSSIEGLQVAPHMVPHGRLRQGFRQQGIERLQLLQRELGQGHPQVIGNGAYGIDSTGKGQLMKRTWIAKRLRDSLDSREARGENRVSTKRCTRY